jgi:hypothetical protein
MTFYNWNEIIAEFVRKVPQGKGKGKVPQGKG